MGIFKHIKPASRQKRAYRNQDKPVRDFRERQAGAEVEDRFDACLEELDEYGIQLPEQRRNLIRFRKS